MKTTKFSLRAALFAWALSTSIASAAESHRVAVIVGSNRAAAGLQPLKYSHRDAQSIAEVLVEAGEFPRADVHVLLDPEPSAVLVAMDSALSRAKVHPGETMLLFYYSGHADDRALYPNGKALPYSELKPRLESASAVLRVGIIDACSGGAWTRSKGLHPEAPFEVSIPLEMGAEGSVLISSSSGVESAHEADALQGSFFTHHLVAGLRGAASRSTRGDVSLHDAFAYAQQLTIRDTARLMEHPQHPSFDMRVRGRNDIALTRVERSASVIVLEQHEGPLQLVQLSTGIVVAELPSGQRAVRLAVPPGEYLVRRLSLHGTWARPILVEPNRTLAVDEASLELMGEPALAAKEFRARPRALDTTVAAHHLQLSGGVGVSRSEAPVASGGFGVGPSVVRGGTTFPVNISLAWGVTDRLELYLAGVAYRFGNVGATEWLPWAGVTGLTCGSGCLVASNSGLLVRQWFGLDRSLNVRGSTESSAPFGPGPQRWMGSGSLGWSQTFDNRVTLNIGANFFGDLVALRPLLGLKKSSAFAYPSLGFGGVQSYGSHSLPLLQVHLGASTSLDGNVWTALSLQGKGWTAGCSLGLSHTF